MFILFLILLVLMATWYCYKIAFFAPTPVPTIIAVGVARPKAQGHEITKTDSPIFTANSNHAPIIIHTIKEIRAIKITPGTK